MFTGIVEAVGEVVELRKKENLYTLVLKKPRTFTDIHIGDSVANDGVCLTVTAIKKGCLCFDLMKETLEATTLGQLVSGSQVNLERAMQAQARIGGHFVTGHVDATGTIKEVRVLPNYVEYRLSIPKPLMRYVVAKGSVTIDGISLTVGEVASQWFAVYFIPHTLSVTTIGQKKAGDRVNIETDLLAKYLLKSKEDVKQSRITKQRI